VIAGSAVIGRYRLDTKRAWPVSFTAESRGWQTRLRNRQRAEAAWIQGIDFTFGRGLGNCTCKSLAGSRSAASIGIVACAGDLCAGCLGIGRLHDKGQRCRCQSDQDKLIPEHSPLLEPQLCCSFQHGREMLPQVVETKSRQQELAGNGCQVTPIVSSLACGASCSTAGWYPGTLGLPPGQSAPPSDLQSSNAGHARKLDTDRAGSPLDVGWGCS
jgi:hypothetical protein